MIRLRVPWKIKCILCLVPSLAGLAVFFVIPYFRVLYYSLIDNQFSNSFVGIANYIQTLRNEYFQLALTNNLMLIFIAIPVLILLALVISIALSYGIRRLRVLRAAFVLPMVIPTASAALVWQIFFTGLDNILPVYLLFIWKNIGICIVLMTAAFLCIDKAIYEAAQLDGASAWSLHTKVSIPMIMPTVVFSTLLSIVNSFRIYKETYLFYSGTNYPPDYAYTLQYYMNNNFLKLDYQSLSSSAVMTSALVFLIVLGAIAMQRRYEH